MQTIFFLWLFCAAPAAAQLAEERPITRPVDTQQEPSARDAIVVEVASGRKFTARLDIHTDQTHLWLRREQGAATTLRPIRWDRVVRVRAAGRDFSGEDFLAAVERFRQTVAAPPSGGTRNRKIVLLGDNVAVASGAAGQPQPQPPPPPPQVCSLSIDARIARWSANVDSDGLLVHVYPLSVCGGVVPACGSLDVELVGRLTDTVEPEASFSRLGHWTVPLHPSDFGPNGAVCRLPFQGVYPEHDLAVSLFGLVHATLSVPGQGTFEASDGMVRLRPASPLRDRWQHVSGQRFFPQELTFDGRR